MPTSRDDVSRLANPTTEASEMKAANLALRFALEIASLVAFAFWGSQMSQSPWRLVTLLILPLAAALFWGTFVAPRAKARLDDPTRLTVEIVYFATAAGGVWAVGYPVLALAFFVVATANALAVRAWEK